MAQTSVKYMIRGDIRPGTEKKEYFPFEVQMVDGAKPEAAIAMAETLKANPNINNLFIWEFTNVLEAKQRRLAIVPCRTCGGICTDLNSPVCQTADPDPTRVTLEAFAITVKKAGRKHGARKAVRRGRR